MGVGLGTAGRSTAGRRVLAGDLGAAVVCALMTTTFAVSYSALIYTGPLAVGQPAGFVAIFTACMVTGLVTGLLSSLRFASASLEGNSVVVLAATAVVAGRTMGSSASAAQVSATILTMLMLSGVAIGAVMMALGLLRAGRIVRYIPYQVMAGFLGATGWSLVVGGAAVGVGAPWLWAALAAPETGAKLATTVGVGALLFLVVPRFRHPFAVPAIVAGCIALHLAIAFGLGVPLETQTAHGWLLDAPRHLSIVVPWSPATLGLVDWRALEAATPGLLATVVVAVMTIMLNTNALELATFRDADIDRELVAGGLSAAASGLLGGAPGYVGVGRSLLLLRSGATTRLAPCLAALLAGLVPLLDPSLLGFAPRPVLGGLLVYLGLQLLDEWVVRSRQKLSLLEWLTVLLVLGITIRFGFVVGVIAGVALGCATFAATYSRAMPTRARYRGDVASSFVTRTIRERELLHADAEALLVLHLQGFLFFGTANRLLQDVRAEIAAIPGRLRFMVLDFSSVDGIDGSAVSIFERIAQIAAAEGIVLVFAAVPPAVAVRLDAVPPVARSQRHIAPTLDEGLEWCEETRLTELRHDRTDHPSIHEQLAVAFGDAGMAARFIDRLDRLSVAEGEVVMEQYERSDELVFVESGRVSITLRVPGAPEIRARNVGAGSMLGEIGFLLGEPRTATVRADTDCRLLSLSRETLRRIAQEDPALSVGFYRAMTQLLAHRLVDKDAMIAALVRVAR